MLVSDSEHITQPTAGWNEQLFVEILRHFCGSDDAANEEEEGDENDNDFSDGV